MPTAAFIHGSNDLYGASRVLLADVSILVEEGINVRVVLPSEGPLTSLLAEAGAEVAVEPLHILRKVASPSELRLPLLLPRAARSADIVILWTLATASYLFASRLARKFTVTSIHEILPGRSGDILSVLASKLSHDLMVNSHATSSWLTAKIKPRLKPCLAYPVAPDYASHRPRSPTGALHLLMAGRVNGHKGHLEAVEACTTARERDLPDLRLTLLGGCYPGQEQHLENLLEAIADKPWATYEGEVEDITPALRECDALLVPTIRPEPFGIVALEAWAAGRRIIASDTGGLAEATRMVQGVLVPPSDVHALSQAIVELGESSSLRSPPAPDAEAAHACTRAARTTAWRSVLRGA
jgi:glycosyltransferase involved in cell wall biosynthesis